MKTLAAINVLALSTMLAACGGQSGSETAAPAAQTAKTATEKTVSNEDTLTAILTGDHRSAEEQARDEFRHPKQTLLFFGIEPDMDVVEIWPGGGWYTNVIAPYLATGDGAYYAAHFDPAAGERAARAIEAFKEKYAADKPTYGDVNISYLGGEARPQVAEPGSVDAVLTFRNVHNWGDNSETFFNHFYTALKPGGVLGVVEHRADSEDVEPRTGYVAEASVIKLAEAAGFELEARAEINANPADTKDHPFGVWTLPPVKRSSAVRGEEDPDFDRAKYDAIGESDRMTLKFRKPLAADGALLE